MARKKGIEYLPEISLNYPRTALERISKIKKGQDALSDALELGVYHLAGEGIITVNLPGQLKKGISDYVESGAI